MLRQLGELQKLAEEAEAVGLDHAELASRRLHRPPHFLGNPTGAVDIGADEHDDELVASPLVWL